MSFDFGKYKKTPQTVKIEPPKAKKSFSTPIPHLEKEPTKMATKSPVIDHPQLSREFDEGDVKILEILTKKYTQRGTHVVRYDQKNPFIHDLIRLGYLMQSPDTFKKLHDKGLFEKSKYAGQWKIK
ncbi:MAG: hypothetical protein ACFFC7_32210 [Candidatus Hermodarchaeota archaeon]